MDPKNLLSKKLGAITGSVAAIYGIVSEQPTVANIGIWTITGIALVYIATQGFIDYKKEKKGD